MSDLMLFGILRMPYDMAMGDDLSRRQFYDRAQQAADEIEQQQAEIERLKGYIEEHQSRDALQQMEIERLKAVVEHCAVVRMCSKCAAAAEVSDE